MTIKEAASHYGVSTQAIYQRIAKAGKKARDLTNQKSGDLTEAGAALLASWFTNEASKPVDKACNHCKELEQTVAALQAENKSLQEQLATMQTDKDRLYTLLAQAQQTAQALTVARIGAASTGGTPPLWERIKVFFVGDKARNEG